LAATPSTVWVLPSAAAPSNAASVPSDVVGVCRAETLIRSRLVASQVSFPKLLWDLRSRRPVLDPVPSW
jgi:hypothetical protein